ncbi:site-specific DNA-methyltransferase [Klebsiella pneumoniae]|uniref:site-specific DNA-methyltransferase n=1 Tax=Enterobacterales TaxID=91347 RepID=UPI001C8A72FA|nr:MULTISPECIES: site-specific DNA-methyltransferase [Enterobacterales]MCP6567308.1 site-specific DNA-methyltransferase [Klebsiella pneumoniae]MDM9254603.1 site-specific DNA-methyltransferase [Klebsiella variicola]QZE28807.1 site-specific DNA-methyltransferase [Pantoea ananatis]
MKNVIPEVDSKSMDIVADNVSKLKELFPEVFTEGKVDFDSLKEVLGGYIDGREERYSFTWNGKSKARMLAQTPSTGTLRPCKEESVDWDTTQNLFIEGDNLEVLKLLQKSYHKKVKMIYIDPPYNTGKDFVYKDNFKDNIKNYKEITGQVDGEGRNLSNNPETSGRYHTDWLNMMYPRLKLARNLLKDDGAIFISIDENEITNLRKLCDEVFGEDNFLGTIANVNNPKGRSDDKFIATAHEYIVIYSKNIVNASTYGFDPDEKITKRYNKVDSVGKVYREIDLRKTGDSDRREDRPDMFYYFYFDESTGALRVSKEKLSRTDSEIEIYPVKDDGSEGRWRWGFTTALQKIDSVYAKFMPARKIWGIFEKDYLEGRPPVKSTSTWAFKDVNSERGSEQFIDLGFDKEVFQRPKPVGTLRRVLEVGTIPGEPALVIDFFAGSGALAHSAYELMADKERDLNYILVQLPELCGEGTRAKSDGFSTIAEISKERIRRAAAKIKEDNPDYQGDLGFKVFKLDSTNIKPWELDFDLTEQDLEDQISNIKHGRKEEDVLYEVLLKYGLDLTLPIAEHSVAGHKVFDIGMGALVICLSDDITLDVVEGIAKLKDELNPEIMRVVFKDAGFADDVVKTNAVQILKQAGIEDVRSL